MLGTESGRNPPRGAAILQDFHSVGSRQVAEVESTERDRDQSAGLSRRQMGKLEAVPYYPEIRDALGQPGCAFCRLLTVRADRYLDAVLWELVNDHAVRAELNEARGYCQQHGWLLVRKGAALGVAILMRDVVKTLLDVAAANPAESKPESVLKAVRRSLDRDRVSTATAPLVAQLSPQRPCPACQQPATKRNGHDRRGRQKYTCRPCRRTFTEDSASAFSGYRWPRDVILTAVRWYLAYPLSSRQVLELLAERGTDVSHRTILDWVQAFGPQLAAEVRRRRRPVG